MAATKGLEDIEKLEFHLVWLAGLKWHGVLEALAELTAEGLASHKLFITAHLYPGGIRIGIRLIPWVNVNELDDPIGIGAAGGDVEDAFSGPAKVTSWVSGSV